MLTHHIDRPYDSKVNKMNSFFARMPCFAGYVGTRRVRPVRHVSAQAWS